MTIDYDYARAWKDGPTDTAADAEPVQNDDYLDAWKEGGSTTELSVANGEKLASNGISAQTNRQLFEAGLGSRQQTTEPANGSKYKVGGERKDDQEWKERQKPRQDQDRDAIRKKMELERKMLLGR